MQPVWLQLAKLSEALAVIATSNGILEGGDSLLALQLVGVGHYGSIPDRTTLEEVFPSCFGLLLQMGRGGTPSPNYRRSYWNFYGRVLCVNSKHHESWYLIMRDSSMGENLGIDVKNSTSSRHLPQWLIPKVMDRQKWSTRSWSEV